MNFMPMNSANSNELELLLKRYKLPKFSEEEIDNTNCPISMWEFEFVIKN